jgi:hypothetical protein
MRKIADVNRKIGLIAQLEERRLCEAEAGGSNPPESTSMHPEMRVTGEGLKVFDLTRPCKGA